jgi:hypothetical protein
MKTFKQYVNVSEAIAYHLAEDVPFAENVYRMHSDGFYKFFTEARRLYAEGHLEVYNTFDIELLESDIGEFGEYEGEMVPLDAPFAEYELDEEDEKQPIGKPMRGGPKKFYVFVRKPDGGVKKVTFGDKGGSSTGQTLTAKFTNPEARKSFVARHKCSQQTDRTSAAYWSCRLPHYAKALGLSGGGSFFW